MLSCIASEIRNNWLLSETSSHRSMSPSDSRSSSSVDTGAGGATDVEYQELESMDPSEVPFVIGVTDNNPYNCQFCEKAFSKKAYLKHHEQVTVLLIIAIYLSLCSTLLGVQR